MEIQQLQIEISQTTLLTVIVMATTAKVMEGQFISI